MTDSNEASTTLTSRAPTNELTDFAAWLRPLAVVEPCGSPTAAGGHGRLVGQSIALDLELDELALIHRPSDTRLPPSQLIGFAVIEDGKLFLDAAEKTSTLKKGDVGLLDFSQPFVAIAVALKIKLLIVPRSRLPLGPGDPSEHVRSAAGDPVAIALARNAITTMSSALPSDKPSLACEMTLAVLQAFMRPAFPKTARLLFDRRDRSTLGQMCRFIDGRLQDHDLSAEMIAGEFGVLRATVFRTFSQHGGVAGYIRDVRLDAAFTLLNGNRHAGLRLNVLANRFGFASGDSFARAFHKRFGIRPMQMRQGGDDAIIDAELHRAGSGIADTSPLDRWLRHCVLQAKLTQDAI